MVQLTLEGISSHLTRDVIQKAFKQRTGSEDTVESLELSPAAAAGSGLIGAVYRIKVTGKKHSASFIAKALVSDPLLRKSLPTEIFFQREIFFFSNVLPTLCEIQKSSGATERLQTLVPICYAYHCDGNSDYILMEDLSEKDCLPVSAQPTVKERNAILKTLAQLHAASMALRVKRPDEFDILKKSLRETYYTESRRNLYTNYLKIALQIDLEALSKLEDPSTSRYYEKFHEIATNDPYSQLVSLVQESDHMVFNHGDAWTPNFLYANEKAVTIDFQLARCASPVTDLNYFLLLCLNTIPSKEEFMKTVRLYYEYLTYYLKDMGVDQSVFTWEDLCGEFKKYGKFGLLAASTSIPLLGSERCDVLANIQEKYRGMDFIPLEVLWPLSPLHTEDQKMNLLGAVRIMVDLDFV